MRANSQMAGSSRNRNMWMAIRIIAAVVVTLVMFFPVYWLVISAFKTQAEMRMAVPTFWPESFMFDNFVQAFQVIPYARFFSNTLIMAVGTIILQLNVALMAAYAFAKGQFWGRDALFFLVLAALIVPEQVIFVPVYVMMSKLDWLNTFWALIVPHGASAYASSCSGKRSSRLTMMCWRQHEWMGPVAFPFCTSCSSPCDANDCYDGRFNLYLIVELLFLAAYHD